MNARHRLLALSLLSVLALAACGKDTPAPFQPVPVPPTPTSMPDFALQDVNPNSVTFDQAVSPRQKLSKVSAWYFGHAT